MKNAMPSPRQERKQKRKKKLITRIILAIIGNYYCNCGGLAAIKIMADDELGVS